MRNLFSPAAFASYLIILSILGIGAAVYREISQMDSKIQMMREGYLNEIAHLMVSTLALSMREGTWEPMTLKEAFRPYEEMDSKNYYEIASRKDVALQFLMTDRQGVVIYDSSNEALGKDLSKTPPLSTALSGGYDRVISTEGGMNQSFVAIPIRVNGEIKGAVRVGKPGIIVLSIQKEAQRSVILVGIAGVLISLLLVLLVFIFFLKPLELWFSYTGLFKNKLFPTNPRLRRTRFGAFGEVLDHIYQSLSGRSYVEEVLGGLGHELKSPLTSIKGILGVLEQPIPDEDRKQFLDDAYHQVDRISRVVDRMLALASLERRDRLKELKRVELDFLLESVVADLEPTAREFGISIQFKMPQGYLLHCDPFLVRQSVINLMLNALEHSGSGTEVRLRVKLQEKYLELSVRDQGGGIPDFALDRVFEKFYSLPKMDPSLKGTGLGLNFVRQVAELHFGDITLTNHPEGGVLASLRFPVALVDVPKRH